MKSISPELIQKYLQGKCSLEEEAAVLNWYNSFENQPDPYQKLSVSEQEDLRLRMLSNIEKETDLSEKLTQPVQNEVKKDILKYIIFTVSAAAVLLLVFNVSMFLKRNKLQQAVTIPDEELVITNKTKTIYKQILPDNSVVWLSPDAQISYHKNFKKNLREISLSGESFFEVTKDKKHPFVVYSNNLVTRVWGTSFRVRDAKNDAVSEVAVVTGKVSVEVAVADHQPKNENKTAFTTNLMLFPQQNAVYKKALHHLQKGVVNEVSTLNIWKKANLTFEKIPLKEVLLALDKQYHVTIRLDDQKLNNYLLQADFNDQSLPDVMEMLKQLLKLTYVTDGKNFMLQKGS